MLSIVLSLLHLEPEKVGGTEIPDIINVYTIVHKYRKK